jgi:Sulfotransferase family
MVPAMSPGIRRWISPSSRSSPKFAPQAFVFSVVRNPYDRLISSWQYLSRTKDRPLPDALSNPPQEGSAYMHLTRQQIVTLQDEGGGLVTDKIMRFESLQADFDDVCDRLGKRRVTLPKTNASQREVNYRQYFNAETRKLAEALFRNDLEAFGYDF